MEIKEIGVRVDIASLGSRSVLSIVTKDGNGDIQILDTVELPKLEGSWQEIYKLDDIEFV